MESGDASDLLAQIDNGRPVIECEVLQAATQGGGSSGGDNSKGPARSGKQKEEPYHGLVIQLVRENAICDDHGVPIAMSASFADNEKLTKVKNRAITFIERKVMQEYMLSKQVVRRLISRRITRVSSMLSGRDDITKDEQAKRDDWVSKEGRCKQLQECCANGTDHPDWEEVLGDGYLPMQQQVSLLRQDQAEKVRQRLSCGSNTRGGGGRDTATPASARCPGEQAAASGEDSQGGVQETGPDLALALALELQGQGESSRGESGRGKAQANKRRKAATGQKK